MGPALAVNPKYFQIYGEGLGSKASELIRKTDIILESGFHMSKRQVLGWSFFESYLKRCGASEALSRGEPLERVQEKILCGEFSFLERRTIEQICRSLADHPALAVRSSAQGDARGTGVYESHFCLNNAEPVIQMAKRVLASHYSEKAQHFRWSAHLVEGIAVMIEPVVVEPRMYSSVSVPSGIERIYAPLSSGFGYTDGKEGAYVGAVRGLACEYVNDPRIGYIFHKEPGFDDFHTDFPTVYFSSHGGRSFADSLESGGAHAISSGGELVQRPLSMPYSIKAQEGVLIRSIFEPMERLHMLGGDRQYIEWAAKMGGPKPQQYITQIADAPQISFDFTSALSSPGYLATADWVVGEGAFRPDFIIHIRDGYGLQFIGELNSKYPNYLLVMDYAKNSYFSYASIPYPSIDQSIGIAELNGPSKPNLSTLGSHFGGLMGMTNKVMVRFRDFDLRTPSEIGELCEQIKTIDSPEYVVDAVRVYKVKWQLTASELQQMAVLERLP